MKIYFISNHSKSLVLFRADLIKKLVKLGHSVTAFAPEDDTRAKKILNEIGAHYCKLYYSRTSVNIFKDILYCIRLVKLFKSEKPDIVMLYTNKPIIYGSLAARFAGIKKCFSFVTGLGSVFIEQNIKNKILGAFLIKMYSIALRFNNAIFFLNPDDYQHFLNKKIIQNSQTIEILPGEGVNTAEFRSDLRSKIKVKILNGSGVNLIQYNFHENIESNSCIFLLIGRLIKDKGILEYIEAAKSIKQKYSKVVFLIVGPTDTNPTAITLSEINKWKQEKIVNYCGETNNVKSYIKRCTVFVLPSYREGLPRTIVEAMAMGKPIITTDAPGCRETVIHGENGFLVPIKNINRLSNAMEKFILNPEIIRPMGQRSRQLAEQRFDVNKINDQIYNIIGS